MTIRLTSPEAFDRVLEELKRDPYWDDEFNEWFFQYGRIVDIKEEILKGDDEIYLDVEWRYEPRSAKYILLEIRCHKRSEIMTDVEYLMKEENERED